MDLDELVQYIENNKGNNLLGKKSTKAAKRQKKAVQKNETKNPE